MFPIRALLHAFLIINLGFSIFITTAQDYGDEPAAPPPAEDDCTGIFISYTFTSRQKEFPHVKNASAQAYAFKAMATILNAGEKDLKAWKVYIGFQHGEILVSASGAVLTDGTDFPAHVGNGTYFSGFPNADLKNSIDTAGDLSQIRVEIDITGTQFGVKSPGIPMPKTIRLANDGYKCPKPSLLGGEMYVCCMPDPKYKANTTSTSTKFLPRQYGDLTIDYDVLQAFEGNYLAQVTIDNNNPLGRLDNWNLTWDWMRGEFIYTMRGAYTTVRDSSECIYGAAGQYYQSFDFTPVMNCQKRPTIHDLPPEKAKDNNAGNLPYCCKNGMLLPPTMNSNMSKAIFQLQVYKVPPDMNRTALFPPQNWKITGVLNPDYKCGPPVRVSPMEFPDPSGLDSKSLAVVSWQIVCNITRPKLKSSRCCVSFSAFYNDSVIPCNTCACGCPASAPACDPNAPPLLLPSEALLIPFANRTAKAKAWAKIKHYKVPNPIPCGDYCGVSINWHIYSDFRKGWTARITLFNWEEFNFQDWFVAVQLKAAEKGYEHTYSFNGTRLPGHNDTLFMQGLPGLNYLMGQVEGEDPEVDTAVPGKQQTVVSFTKKLAPGIDIVGGDGFPSRVYFNGEECAMPDTIPRGGARARAQGSGVFATMVLACAMVYVLVVDGVRL
ncbi:COBRA-like protein 10 [Acorus calamus]|uniref:COBRA-like protein 10 n=1 Tax=Acorus calamus TaxID=4465 RepID=A0AAV9C344_ACOCL|nr:COBRA-like protein 10 [Acorus calamus]